MDVRFPTYQSDCTSYCGGFLFRKNIDGHGDVILDAPNLLSNHAGRQLSMITTTAGVLPTYSSKINHYTVPYANVVSESRSCFFLSEAPRTYALSTQWTSAGFTGGTLNTMKSELCNYFQEVKGLTNNGASWNIDFGTNIVFLSISFDDDAGKTYYQPIFYHGNSGTLFTDQQYDWSTFETGDDGWTWDSTSLYDPLHGRTTVEKHSGSYSYKVVEIDPNDPNYDYWRVYFYKIVTCVAGVVTCWVKSNDTFRIEYWLNGSIQNYQTIGPSSSWQQITFNVSAGSVNIKYNCYYAYCTVNESNFKLYTDDISFPI